MVSNLDDDDGAIAEITQFCSKATPSGLEVLFVIG